MDSSENSTTLLECQPILAGLHSLVWTLSHAESSLCCPVSTGHSRHPSPTAFLELLCPTLWPAFPSYFRSLEISSPKPFVWFRAKTDKGIVCLVDYLHSVTTWKSTSCLFQLKCKDNTTRDSSMRGLGTTLINDNKIVAFVSKRQTDAELRYANIERELLAVIFGCERFHT